MELMRQMNGLASRLMLSPAGEPEAGQDIMKAILSARPLANIIVRCQGPRHRELLSS
jgi:hypothetical protein